MKHNGIMHNGQSDSAEGTELSRKELEIISIQEGKSVFRLELDTGAAIRFLPDGSSELLDGLFPQVFIDSGRVCEESAEDMLELCRAARNREPGRACDVWLIADDGRRRRCSAEYSLVAGQDGAVGYALVSIRDETELHDREMAYEKWRESLLNMFAENAFYAEFNLTRGIMERQTGLPADSAGALAGCTVSAFVEYACEQVIFKDDREDYREFFDRERLLALFERGVSEDTLEYREQKNGVQWMRASVQMTHSPGTGEVRAFIVYTNIDRQRSELERLAQLASRDSLTNILNRKAMEDRITERLNSADGDTLSALYIIDLDDFKQINDRFGHQAGDQTLKGVAAALNNTFRSGDIVGRLGGDEFMAFIFGVTERNAVSRANRLLNELQFLVENASLSASVGLALCKGKAEFSALYRDADKALYKSKAMGKNRFTIYRHSDREQELPEPDEAKESGLIQLQTLLEYMDGGVIIVEIHGDDVNEVYISPSYYTTMQRTPGKHREQGKALFNGIVEEHKRKVMNALKMTSMTGEPTDTVYQVVAAGGTEWHHLRAARLPDAGGTPRIIGVVTDISELKHSSSQLEAIVNYSTVGIAMFELSAAGNRLSFINPKLQTMLGMNAEQINSMPDTIEMLSHGMLSHHHEQGDCVPGSEDSTFEFLCRGADIPGAPQNLYLQARGVHIYDSADSAVVLIMYLDITRERAMEDQLRMAEERYRIAAAQTGMFIWEVDIASRTMRMLSAGEGSGSVGEVYVNAPESLLAGGMIHHDSEQVLRVMFADIYAGRESDEYVLRRIGKDGTYIWARARYTLVRGADGEARQAVGVSEIMPNIDAELRELRRVWQFSGLVEEFILANFHINLTRNQVDYIHMGVLELEDYPDLQTLEDCKQLLASVVAEDEENTSQLATLSTEGLIELYRQGRKTYMFELKASADGSRWFSLFADLMRDPLSGDIWGFIYLREISKKRVTESLLSMSPAYDTATRLYTYATVRAAIDAVSAGAQPESRIVMSVLELAGFDQLVSQQGTAEGNRVLNIVGRLLRLLVADGAIFGHLTQNRFILMYTDVDSPDDWREKMRVLVARANDLLHKSEISEAVRFFCGYVSSAAGEADCGALIRKASVACRAAVQTGIDIAVYSELELDSLPDDRDTADMDSGLSPEMAALTRRCEELELRCQELINRQTQSEFDKSTGLYIYDSFCREVQEKLKDASELRAGGEWIAAVGIQRFDVYSSANGEQAGEQLARRLAEILKNSGIMASRVNSSLFMLFANSDEACADALFGELRRCVAGMASFLLDVRMGVCSAADRGVGAMQLCSGALAAMHTAADGEIEVYSQEKHGRYTDTQGRLNEMLSALSEEQLVLYFRPQIDCRSGRTAGFDARVCWKHPTKGELPQESFVAQFEHGGLAVQLNEYVAVRCCRFIRQWQDRYGSPVTVSVPAVRIGTGMSASEYCSMLGKMAERYGVDRSMIVPQVREDMYLTDAGQLSALVEQLGECGFTVGMEGFGRGCSPLNALMEIPFGFIRLDEGFVSGCIADRRRECVLSALLNAARQMGARVVASCVDDAATAEKLQKLGCLYIQGEIAGAAMTATQLLKRKNDGEPQFAPLTDYGYWESCVRPALETGDAAGVARFVEEMCVSGMCGMVIADFDEQANIEFANTAACRIFSFRDEKTLHSRSRKRLLSLVLPDDREYVRRCIRQLNINPEQVGFECRVKTADDRIIWIKGRMRIAAKTEGQRVIVCEFFDVTHHHSEEQERILDSYSDILMSYFNEVCELNSVDQTLTVRYSSYGNRRLGEAMPLKETVTGLCNTLIIPEHAQRLPEYIERAGRMKPGERQEVEYDLRGRDGRVHTVYSRAIPIDSTRCMLCNVDITTRKRHELARRDDWLNIELRREREKYYSMVERLGSAIVEWDLIEDSCWCSESCARYAMNSKGSASTGGMVSSGVHSEDMVSFAMFMSQLEGSDDHADTTLRMRMSDSSYRWTRLSGETVRDSNGVPVRVMVSLTDVDDDMQHRSQIADYAARSAAFIENIPGGVVIADIGNGEINGKANDNLCNLLGYTGSQMAHIIHNHWTDIVTPGDRSWIEAEIYRLITGEQKQVDVICSLRHRRGYDVAVRVMAALIGKNEASVTVAFIFVDEQIENT